MTLRIGAPSWFTILILVISFVGMMSQTPYPEVARGCFVIAFVSAIANFMNEVR